MDNETQIDAGAVINSLAAQIAEQAKTIAILQVQLAACQTKGE